MKLSIIVSDKAVYLDNYCIAPLEWVGTPTNVHALQWQNNAGWIEFNDGTFQEDITELPVWANNAITAFNTEKNKPTPTDFTSENKVMAQNLLSSTDWATISDVADKAKSEPYLTNVQDFIVFRNQVRKIAINPPSDEIVFPSIPKAVWSANV